MVEFIVPALSEDSQLEECFERLHDLIGRSEGPKMVIDLSKVQFLASRAIALLIALARSVEYRKGTLRLCGVRKRLQQVFRFSGLVRFFVFHDTRDDAVASFDTADPE